MRPHLKTVAEVVLTASGSARLAIRRQANRTLIVAWHNIVPRGQRAAGDHSLHLPQERFAQQLDLLARIADVVPLEDALLPAAPSRRPRVALTFDDATQGALTAGVAELTRRGLPATVFVAPAFVGHHPFWWDTFAGSAGLPDDLRAYALDHLAGRDDAIRAWAGEHGHPSHAVPDHQTCASLDQLAAAARLGVRFGAHSWSHPNLTALPRDELEAELQRPLEWLRAHMPTALPWLAYPYGFADERVASAARAAGYLGALRVDGGWIPDRDADPFQLPRLNVPAGLSARGLALRISGLLS